MGAIKEHGMQLVDELVSLHMPPDMYTEAYLSACPCCGSTDCDCESEELSGSVYKVYGWCNACDARWEDRFSWSGRTVTQEGWK